MITHIEYIFGNINIENSLSSFRRPLYFTLSGIFFKRYDKMISTLKNLATEYEQAYENVTKNTFFDKKELAEHLQKYYNKYMNYIYCRLNRPELTGFDYILKQSRKTILSLLRGAKYV